MQVTLVSASFNVHSRNSFSFNEVGLAVAKSIEQICYGFSIPVQPSPYYWLFLPFGSLFICLYIVLIYSLSAHDAVVSISNFYHKESGTSQISTGEISIWL